MIGLFRVHYFDPRGTEISRGPHRNMECVTVSASNATEAIRKAEKHKSVKRYRVEEVSCLGISDE